MRKWGVVGYGLDGVNVWCVLVSRLRQGFEKSAAGERVWRLICAGV